MNNEMKQQIYTTLFEGAPDAILFADREGIIQLWNRGAELIFGYSAAEAIGQSLDLVIPEKLQQRHKDGYGKVMGSGATEYGSALLSVPAQHKDGSRLFSDFSIVMIKDGSGQMQGIAAIMRDTTAQKIKERELIERIKELESELK